MKKKGFTLTELLVVIVILGIIAGISIPLIRNLRISFEKRKYQSYADSVLYAAKLYNDSYNDDLFGHNLAGCAYVTYEKLVEKRLLEDIEVEGVSCNNYQTYVKINKIKDQYKYTTYLACGKKTDGPVRKVTLTIPDEIPVMDDNLCSGVNAPSPVISVNDSEADIEKLKHKTRVTIESSTGVNSGVTIYAKWSKMYNDYDDTGFKKVSFKIKANDKQEETILETNTYKVNSKEELVTPRGPGDFYLILRVDHLNDLYGNKWKNPVTEGSKFIAFGPFKTKSSDIEGDGPIRLDLYYENAGKWTKDNINLEIRSEIDTDSYPIDNYYQTFNANLSYDKWTPMFEEFDAKPFYFVKTYSDSQENQLFVRVCNIGGECDEKTTWLRIDKTLPDKPTVVNSSKGEWTSSNVTLTVSSNDTWSGIDKYYYTYAENPQNVEFGTNPDTSWAVLEGGDNKTRFKTKPWTGIAGGIYNKTVYVKVCDVAGNCTMSDPTNIKIDKQAPSKPVISNPHENEWVNKSYDITITSNDGEGAGINKYYYSYNKKAKVDNLTYWSQISCGTGKTTCKDTWSAERNQYVYIKVCDKVGNCSQISKSMIKIDKTGPSCKTTKSNTKKTTGVTATFSCSDGKGIGLASDTCPSKKTKLKSSQSYTIKDKLGNTSTCNVTVTKYCSEYKCDKGQAFQEANYYEDDYDHDYAFTFTKSDCYNTCNTGGCHVGEACIYKYIKNNFNYVKNGDYYYIIHCGKRGGQSVDYDYHPTWNIRYKINKRGCCACCDKWSCKTYKYK